jgi:hypothetical protein
MRGDDPAGPGRARQRLSEPAHGGMDQQSRDAALPRGQDEAAGGREIVESGQAGDLADDDAQGLAAQTLLHGPESEPGFANPRYKETIGIEPMADEAGTIGRAVLPGGRLVLNPEDPAGGVRHVRRQGQGEAVSGAEIAGLLRHDLVQGAFREPAPQGRIESRIPQGDSLWRFRAELRHEMGERTGPLRAVAAGTEKLGHGSIRFCSVCVLIDSKKRSESQGESESGEIG